MNPLHEFRHADRLSELPAYTDDFFVDSLGPRVWRWMSNGVDTTVQGADVAAATEILRLKSALAEERSRIRRELREALEPEIRIHRIPGSQTEVEVVMVSDISAALDRICPKEKE